MTAFILGCLFNVVTFCGILASGKLRKSLSGIYLMALVSMDTVYLITHTVMNQFYTKWIRVDIFQESDSIVLCQIWNFLEENAIYFRYLMIVIVLVDRYMYLTGMVSPGRLRKSASFVLAGSEAVSAALAVYWAVQVKETLQQPYQFGACAIAPPRAPTNSGEWFYMELIVHLIYPDIILNLARLVMIVLVTINICKVSSDKVEDSGHNLTKCLTLLGSVHLLLQIPYLIMNCAFLYVNFRWGPYDFSEDVWNNISYTGLITIELKDFIYSLTFLALIFAKEFRRLFCSD